jgi:hypothetical protein
MRSVEAVTIGQRHALVRRPMFRKLLSMRDARRASGPDGREHERKRERCGRESTIDDHSNKDIMPAGKSVWQVGRSCRR